MSNVPETHSTGSQGEETFEITLNRIMANQSFEQREEELRRLEQALEAERVAYEQRLQRTREALARSTEELQLHPTQPVTPTETAASVIDETQHVLEGARDSLTQLAESVVLELQSSRAATPTAQHSAEVSADGENEVKITDEPLIVNGEPSVGRRTPILSDMEIARETEQSEVNSQPITVETVKAVCAISLRPLEVTTSPTTEAEFLIPIRTKSGETRVIRRVIPRSRSTSPVINWADHVDAEIPLEPVQQSQAAVQELREYVHDNSSSQDNAAGTLDLDASLPELVDNAENREEQILHNESRSLPVNEDKTEVMFVNLGKNSNKQLSNESHNRQPVSQQSPDRRFVPIDNQGWNEPMEWDLDETARPFPTVEIPAATPRPNIYPAGYEIDLRNERIQEEKRKAGMRRRKHTPNPRRQLTMSDMESEVPSSVNDTHAVPSTSQFPKRTFTAPREFNMYNRSTNHASHNIDEPAVRGKKTTNPNKIKSSFRTTNQSSQPVSAPLNWHKIPHPDNRREISETENAEQQQLKRLHRQDPENYRLKGTLFGNLKCIKRDPRVDPPRNTCFSCWEPGHERNRCPQPKYRVFCFNCGRLYVGMNTCERCGDEHTQWLRTHPRRNQEQVTATFSRPLLSQIVIPRNNQNESPWPRQSSKRVQIRSPSVQTSESQPRSRRHSRSPSRRRSRHRVRSTSRRSRRSRSRRSPSSSSSYEDEKPQRRRGHEETYSSSSSDSNNDRSISRALELSRNLRELSPTSRRSFLQLTRSWNERDQSRDRRRCRERHRRRSSHRCPSHSRHRQ